MLPDAEGTPTTLTEKVYVPVKEHPDVSNVILVLMNMARTSSLLVLTQVDVPTQHFRNFYLHNDLY